jgi:hypothetical protein
MRLQTQTGFTIFGKTVEIRGFCEEVVGLGSIDVENRVDIASLAVKYARKCNILHAFAFRTLAVRCRGILYWLCTLIWSVWRRMQQPS